MVSSQILVVLIESTLGGLIAIFTPYSYAVYPITLSYIRKVSPDKFKARRNSILCAIMMVAFFSLSGSGIGMLVSVTGLRRLAHNWILNLVFCRIFLVLGLSFLGAFEINLPIRLMRRLDFAAKVNSVRGLFFLTLSLPAATISSTGPIAGLILVLAAHTGIPGIALSMAGFSIGFSMPILFPAIVNLLSASLPTLNQVKVLLGFFSLLIGFKFLSNTDVALGWNVIDDRTFITLLFLLAGFTGCYLLGFVKLNNDYIGNVNLYKQTYVTLSRLFLAIGLFTFAVYLLPGIWGAPLHKISSLLPSHYQ